MPRNAPRERSKLGLRWTLALYRKLSEFVAGNTGEEDAEDVIPAPLILDGCLDLDALYYVNDWCETLAVAAYNNLSKSLGLPL